MVADVKGDSTEVKMDDSSGQDLQRASIAQEETAPLSRLEEMVREEDANANNVNNNQLGEFSHSTAPVDKKKRPSILGNAAFFFAVVDVALASACSW